MKYLFGLSIIFILASFTNDCQKISFATNPMGIVANDTIPKYLIGDFEDDYGIKYSLNDSVFIQQQNIKYHIIHWNLKEHYFIARNDMQNPSEQGLFTRVDFMPFEKMEPFVWGFCFTEYKASTLEIAQNTKAADRKNPKIGCGGYPFSRMKPIRSSN